AEQCQEYRDGDRVEAVRGEEAFAHADCRGEQARPDDGRRAGVVQAVERRPHRNQAETADELDRDREHDEHVDDHDVGARREDQNHRSARKRTKARVPTNDRPARTRGSTKYEERSNPSASSTSTTVTIVPASSS